MEHRRTLLRIVALALLLYALASLLTVRRELARAEALCRTLGGEILQLQQEFQLAIPERQQRRLELSQTDFMDWLIIGIFMQTEHAATLAHIGMTVERILFLAFLTIKVHV